MTELTALLPYDEKRSVQAILACASLCAPHGVSLTQADAQSIARTHIRALSDNRIVEIGCGSVERIIREFAPSPYADAGSFVSLVETMTEAFCYLKREADREISDTMLISAMRAMFERSSQGSEDLFLGWDLDRLRECLTGKNPRQTLMRYLLDENTLEFMEAPTVGDRGEILREYFGSRRETEPEVWEEKHGRYSDF